MGLSGALISFCLRTGHRSSAAFADCHWPESEEDCPQIPQPTRSVAPTLMEGPLRIIHRFRRLHRFMARTDDSERPTTDEHRCTVRQGPLRPTQIGRNVTPTLRRGLAPNLQPAIGNQIAAKNAKCGVIPLVPTVPSAPGVKRSGGISQLLQTANWSRQTRSSELR